MRNRAWLIANVFIRINCSAWESRTVTSVGLLLPMAAPLRSIACNGGCAWQLLGLGMAQCAHAGPSALHGLQSLHHLCTRNPSSALYRPLLLLSVPVYQASKRRPHTSQCCSAVQSAHPWPLGGLQDSWLCRRRRAQLLLQGSPWLLCPYCVPL